MIPRLARVPSIPHTNASKPSGTDTPTSADLINRALQRTLRQKELGNRLQLSRSRVSRIVAGEPLGFLRCLMLADLLDEDPAVVMNAYGYVRLVELLQRLYVARGYVTGERARIHNALDRLLDALPTDDQHTIRDVIDRFLSVVTTGNREGGAR
jgi:hypothetical protein